MRADTKKQSGMRCCTYSIQSFMKQVVAMLIALVTVSSAVVVLLIYLPLKTELEKSLIENFSQLSYIRFAALQNNMGAVWRVQGACPAGL